MSDIQVGQPAPEFSVKAANGDTVTLSEFKGAKNVVLVFYPLDFSSVCSMQLPEYSGKKDEFADHDTVVLGINRDSVYTHKAWAAEFGIEIPLLSDMTGSVARSYGVYLEDKGMNTRAVFLIDKAGIVRSVHVENTPGEFTLPAHDVLKTIQSWAG